MSKIKSFFKRNGKKFSIVVASAFMVVVSCVSSFAAEAGAATSSSDLQSSFSTAISSIQSDVLGYRSRSSGRSCNLRHSYCS